MENNRNLQSTNSNKAQLSYLNYLRFGSILVVILLHCVSPFLENPYYASLPSYKLILSLNEIGRAGVPLFFMISGFLLLRDPRTVEFASFYRRRLSRILIPLGIWNVVYCVHYHKDISTFFAESIRQGCAYHLWFLYTLLGIYLLTPFMKQLVDHCTRKQLWWLLILISFTGTLRPMFNLSTPFYLYLFPPLMEGYIAYFLFGYLLGTAQYSDKKQRISALLLMTSGFALGVLGNLALSSPEDLTLPLNSGYSLNHFLLAGGVFLFARGCRWMERQRIKSFGQLCSSITFQIYFVHVLIMDCCGAWIPDAGPILTVFIRFLFTAAGSILVSLALHGLCGLLKSKTCPVS